MRHLVVVGLLLTSPPAVHALQDRSPIADLLRLATAALDDLRFDEADSIARIVAELPASKRAHRIQAWAIAAAARFPDVLEAQRPDESRRALARLVRIAPEVRLPRDLSWRGLDSLHRSVRATTFGAMAFPEDSAARVGVGDRFAFQALATRPTRFFLLVRPAAGGAVRALDSTTAVEQGSLQVRPFEGDRPLIAGGRHFFEIVAVDANAPDTIRVSYPTLVEIEPLALLDVPGTIPPSRLKPERTGPARSRSAIVGVLAAAGTIAASRLLRPESARSQTDPDGRSITIGLALGAGAAAGTWLLDRGRLIPDHVEANRLARAEFEEERRRLQSENDRRRSVHRATISIEAMP